jgi:hypothetical protein
MLFSDRSVVTMVHGLVFGGGAMMALSAALFFLYAHRDVPGTRTAATPSQARALVWLAVATAVLLWMAVLGGTYLVFPPYRATPPPGTLDLSAYPRALIMASPATTWLHAFGMELKEHVPWMAAMLATAVAFVGVRYRAALIDHPFLRRMATAFVAICLVLVGVVSLMGVFVNKVAPLD